MKCKEIIDIIEAEWPPSLALSWDNVGLLVGSQEQEIKRIFVALDVTEETLAQAVKLKADMIISHHPLLFSPIKQITDKSFTGRRILSLIQNNIACYAMHTNFDVRGMAKLSGQMLQLENELPLEITNEVDEPEGIGQVGELPQELTLTQLAQLVKDRLGLPAVQIYGDPKQRISRAAISGGAGKSMVQPAIDAKAEVLISGDFDHHTGIDAVAMGLSLIDAGHYGTEYPFIDFVSKKLKVLIPDVEVSTATIKMPYWVL